VLGGRVGAATLVVVLLYVGSSTSDGHPEGAGIAIYAVGAGGTLSPAADRAATPSPSFLAAHPRLPVLYAVNEVADGTVSAFAIGPDGGLSPMSRRSSGGAEPTHLAVRPDGRYLACANWGDGTAAVLPVDEDGDLGAPTGVVRHGEPNAHHVSFAGDEVTVVHFKACTLYGYRLVEGGRLERTWQADAGRTGPRHLARHPSGRRYVADEHSSTLSTYVPDPATGGLRRVNSVPATIGAPTTRNYPSEVAVSPDGRYVHLGNRGHDTITTFTADTDVPEPVSEVATGGAFPRHFALAGDWLYVANQHSHTVTALPLVDGIPGPAVHPVATPGPTCVLPRP
jgi:6-phosphogluconolactonase